MAVFVLDTSAILAFLRGEPGEDRVNNLLNDARLSDQTSILVPFVAAMEVEYMMIRSYSPEVVAASLRSLEHWSVDLAESSEVWRHAAAQVKAVYKMSLADAWVASLALLTDAELVHKDPEFDAVASLKHLRLPYTPRTGGQR